MGELDELKGSDQKYATLGYTVYFTFLFKIVISTFSALQYFL